MYRGIFLPLSLAAISCSPDAASPERSVQNQSSQQLKDGVVRDLEGVNFNKPGSTAEFLAIANSDEAREFRRRLEEGEREKARQRRVEAADSAEISRVNGEISEAQYRRNEEKMARELAEAESKRRVAVEEGQARAAADIRLAEALSNGEGVSAKHRAAIEANKAREAADIRLQEELSRGERR